ARRSVSRCDLRLLELRRFVYATHLLAAANIGVLLGLAFGTRARLRERDLGSAFVATKPFSCGMRHRDSPGSRPCKRSAAQGASVAVEKPRPATRFGSACRVDIRMIYLRYASQECPGNAALRPVAQHGE